MGGKKAKIKKLIASNDELKETVASVRGQLTKTRAELAKAKAKTERLTKEVAAQPRAAARSEARAGKLRKDGDRAGTVQKGTRNEQGANAPSPAASVRAQPAAGSVGTDGLSLPSKSWTVVQLQAEARARGLTGTSNKSKAQLLTALSEASPSKP
jgi:septal ring factor EnvC (AmiA/AmiB activator)